MFVFLSVDLVQNDIELRALNPDNPFICNTAICLLYDPPFIISTFHWSLRLHFLNLLENSYSFHSFFFWMTTFFPMLTTMLKAYSSDKKDCVNKNTYLEFNC